MEDKDDKSVTKQKEYLETFFYIKKKNGFFKLLYLKIKKFFFGIKIKIEDVYDANPRWEEARQLIKRMDNLKKKRILIIFNEIIFVISFFYCTFVSRKRNLNTIIRWELI